MFSPPRHPSGLPNYERLHVVGESKAGKSSVALTCARLSRATGSARVFHVLDTDRAYPWMIGAADTNLRLYPEPEAGCYLWEDYVKAEEQLRGNVRPDDFIVIDMLSRSWDKVSDYYIRRMGDEDPTNFWIRMELAARAEKPPLTLQQYVMKIRSVDYALVSKWYHRWLEEIVFRLPCHVLLMSEAKAAGDWKKEKHADVKDMWEREGVVPAGHWQTDYFVHETALLRADNRGGHWVSMKGRDWGGAKRPEVIGMPYRDFALDVFVGKWGWGL